ncbi:MAG: hypothetical protein ACPGEG_04935 [Salibacteraceae bacterium]
MEFPIFRKYFNDKSYFKIVSERSFEEIQIVGNQKHKIVVEAKQFPEMLRIKDMIDCKDGMWLESTQEEYLSVQG